MPRASDKGWLSLQRGVAPAFWCALMMVALSIPNASTAQSAPQWIDVEGAAGAKLRAAVFRPAGDGSFPAVLLLHGSLGMTDDMLEWGRDLMGVGFLVVAACLGRNASVQSASPCPESPLLEQAFAVRNVAAMLEVVGRLPGVRRDRIGLVGYSWGGALALVAASSGVDVQAAVVVAGGPIGRPISNNDPSPLSTVDRLDTPVLILHGTSDDVVRVGTVRQYESRARELGKSVEAYYFEGADHGLWIDQRFRTDLIGRTVAHLQKHLGR